MNKITGIIIEGQTYNVSHLTGQTLAELVNVVNTAKTPEIMKKMLNKYGANKV